MIDSRVDILWHEGVMSDYLRAVKVEDTFGRRTSTRSAMFCCRRSIRSIFV